MSSHMERGLVMEDHNSKGNFSAQKEDKCESLKKGNTKRRIKTLVNSCDCKCIFKC